MDKEVLTLIEAAHYLKVSERTIHRLIASDAIPCAKIGGQWRFLTTTLDSWLQSRMSVVSMRNSIDILPVQIKPPFD